jgi:hypothetical protein
MKVHNAQACLRWGEEIDGNVKITGEVRLDGGKIG